MTAALVRTHSFGQGGATFLPVLEHEWNALWGLPAWATRLFMVLTACSDFKRGHGRTSYGELLNALTPDQPERGPRLESPTLKQVRSMLDRFERLLILARDRSRNEDQQALFFHVSPRAWKSAPTGKQGRDQGRGSTEGKQPQRKHETGQVFQELTSIPPTSQGSKLSTAEQAPTDQKTEPPRGLEPAPTGHAPGPAAWLQMPPEGAPLDSRTIAMRAAALGAALRAKKTDPPGGRAPRPPSSAPRGSGEPSTDPEDKQPSPVMEAVSRVVHRS